MPSAADLASWDLRFFVGPRGTSPGGLSERACVSAIPQAMAGFGAAVDESTRAPATGPSARGDVLQIFVWVAEAPKRARIISISGVRRRGVRWALLPASNLRCPLVGAAPRIPNPNRVRSSVDLGVWSWSLGNRKLRFGGSWDSLGFSGFEFRVSLPN